MSFFFGIFRFFSLSSSDFLRGAFSDGFCFNTFCESMGGGYDVDAGPVDKFWVGFGAGRGFGGGFRLAFGSEPGDCGVIDIRA